MTEQLDWRRIGVAEKTDLFTGICLQDESVQGCLNRLKGEGVSGLTKNSIIGFVNRHFKGKWQFGTLDKEEPTRRITHPGGVAIARANSARKRGGSNNLVLRISAKQKKAPVSRVRQKLADADLSHKTHFDVIKDNQCRYPLWGDDAKSDQFFYCGAPKERGPYCECHASICLDGFSPRKRNQKRVA